MDNDSENSNNYKHNDWSIQSLQNVNEQSSEESNNSNDDVFDD